MKSIEISVCIPVYNGGKFIRECVESCLSQECPNFEVIVVDNLSIDSTAEILKSFHDKNLQVISSSTHVSLAENFQRASRAGSGLFVLMLSADDVLRPGALAAFRRAINNNPTVSLFSGRAGRMTLGPAREMGSAQYLHQVGLIEDLERFLLQSAFPLNINATAIRRDLIDIRIESKMAFDLDLMITLGINHHQGFLIDEEVTGYREHESAASANKALLWRQTLAVYDFHYHSTAYPKLLRARIFRTLFWCVGSLSQEGKKSEARELLSKYLDYLSTPQKCFLRLVLDIPRTILSPVLVLRKLRGSVIKS